MRPRKSSAARPQARRATGARTTRRGAGRCVVVGYDGSAQARHAAAWAARRAAPDGRLVLVHASEPRHRWLPIELLRTGTDRARRGRALIDQLMMDCDEALLAVQMEARVVKDTAARALVDAARSERASEIVVGARKPARPAAIYGDVAAELVRIAPVPVVVVPTGGGEPGAHT